MVRCDDCGQFTRFSKGSGASWAAIYDFAAPGLDHEHCRCRRCTEQLGPVKSNAKPWDGDMSSYQCVL
ncbi:MAG TPA: hypothetical protein VMV81_13020 [Phycisphaerae bacterium]|nr:hypothetical protein [Phycisphaerae bacterium]